MRPGGIVIWRSASLRPPYAKHIAAAGFDVTCLQRASDGYMDRVNMYSRCVCGVGGMCVQGVVVRVWGGEALISTAIV